MGQFTELAPDLYVHHGAINVGILRGSHADGHRALLIDYGDGDVYGTLQALGIGVVERVLFTHHHRDQASGAGALVDAHPSVRFGVPAEERSWFEDVESYWQDPASRWHLYGFRPHHLMLARSLPVHETYGEGDTLSWGGATITVLHTPGHTDGSVSYQVDLKGGERFLFGGDVLYDEGQVWDLYSLQKGWLTEDYHGFMGDRNRLLASAARLASADAVALVPSHGVILRDVQRAVALLDQRVRACYERYAAISALRHYFPGLFRQYRRRSPARSTTKPMDAAEERWQWREGFMPVRAGKAVPAYLAHMGTSWVVHSESGAAFVVDCGTEDVVRQILARQRAGELGTVEGLWISHYHDDHVDAIPQFREAFRCPVVADEHVAQVVEDPLAWRLPCISPVAVRVDRRTRHGESWHWREFTLTAYHLPGQTLYHGGLLVEGRGQRILFAGDSFTMAGIDDYCAGNRNHLGRDVGFDACLQLVQALRPDLILNCHVEEGFDFSDEQLATMRANLAERELLYGELLPWDHPNYGLDESWVRCEPYEQRSVPGEQVRLAVVFTNHSSAERVAVCRPVLPREWGVQLDAGRAVIPPRHEQEIPFYLIVPSGVALGRWVVPVEVAYGEQGAGLRRLGQFREAILDVVRE